VNILNFVQNLKMTPCPLNHKQRLIRPNIQQVQILNSLHASNSHSPHFLTVQIHFLDQIQILVEFEGVQLRNAVLHVVLAASAAEEDVVVFGRLQAEQSA
jgi:hypothetical protein